MMNLAAVFPSPLKDPSSRTLKAATFIPFIALLSLSIVLSFLIMQLLDASAWVEHADLVETEIFKIQKLMIDSETGLRGFELTQDRSFLAPFIEAQSQLPDAFVLINSLIVDPGQKLLAREIQLQFDNWLRLSRGSASGNSIGNGQSPSTLTLAIEGKRQMDYVRSLVNDFITREEQIKSERNQRMTAILKWLLGLGASLSIFITGFWTFFARKAYRTLFEFYTQTINVNKEQVDRHSEERFHSYAEAMPQMAFIANPAGDIIYYNKRWYDYVGIEGTEGWGWKPILHEEDLEPTTAAWRASLSSGKNYDREYRLRRYDGEFRWHLGRAVPIYDHKGEITEWLGTNTDIHDQKLATESLLDLKEKAENANRLKSMFLSNISHEMRTPLGVIIGTTDLVQENISKPEEVANLTSITKRNARHLFGLVNDILDLAKIEAGALLVESRMFPLQSFIDELLGSLEVKANEKSLRLTIRSDGPIPATIESDPFRLTQLLNNLIGNAIKFTEVGSIEVTLRTIFPEDGKSRAQVEFIIKDTGIGLSDEQKEILFTPFAQADGSIARRHGGTGLGLVLSREYAEALGGGVEILKNKVAEGCTFRAWITDGFLSQERFTEIENQTVQLNQSVRIEDSQASPLNGRRILIVDDSADNRLIIGRYLKAAGAVIEQAENGQVGVQKALRGDFDLVLMDLSMPVMDGEQATIQLRSQGFEKPILALTAHAMKGERERSMQIGFTDYITKPVDRSFLIRRIAEF